MTELKLNTVESEAIVTILDGDGSDPVRLISEAGYDHLTFFEHGNWAGVDFRRSDISEVSFAGSDLKGAVFTLAQIEILQRGQQIDVSALDQNDLNETTSSETSSRCEISLMGPIRVHSGNRDDITPRGAKAKALIALLATASDMERQRRWLAAVLWSDRQEQQAAGSLRQCLAEIRKSFGSSANIVRADRQTVSLNADHVTVDLQKATNERLTAFLAHGELLEGLDVISEGFEEWIRDFRLDTIRRIESETSNQ